MAALQIICTILIVAALVLGIVKKFNTPSVMLAIGVVTFIIYSIATGVSSMGDSSIGSSFLDVFELVKSKFASNLSGSCLLIMSVMGYVKYLDHMKATTLLAALCAKPLKKLGKPYLVCVFGILIAAILKLCIPSASGLATLLMATMYPIYLAAGVSVLTAITAINVSVCFDLGPACPITTWACAQEPVAALTDAATFFVQWQLWRTAVIIAVTILVFVITSKRADKKIEVKAEAVEEVDPKNLGVPGFYAILPFVPLILVIIFSKLTPIGIVLSVPAANFLGLCIALVIDVIFGKGTIRDKFNGSGEFWKGMGTSMTSVISLICCASVFSAALDIVGGTKMLMNSIGSSSFGGPILVVAAAAVNFLMVVVTGSGVASCYAILPMLYPAVEASGISLLAVVFAIVSSGGLGRAVCPIAANNIIVCSQTGSDPMEVSKRGALPMLAGFVTMIILAVTAL